MSNTQCRDCFAVQDGLTDPRRGRAAELLLCNACHTGMRRDFEADDRSGPEWVACACCRKKATTCRPFAVGAELRPTCYMCRHTSCTSCHELRAVQPAIADGGARECFFCRCARLNPRLLWGTSVA